MHRNAFNSQNITLTKIILNNKCLSITLNLFVHDIRCDQLSDVIISSHMSTCLVTLSTIESMILPVYLFKPGKCLPQAGRHLFLKIDLVQTSIYVHVCVGVAPPPRLLIPNGVRWHDTDST